MIFKTKEELLEQAKRDKAFDSIIKWIEKQNNLTDILGNCPSKYRLWFLIKGYTQFAEHCNWKEFSGWDWNGLLSRYPQYAEYCDWDKLDGSAWANLLATQPQLAVHCDWSKLDFSDMCYLEWYALPQPIRVSYEKYEEKKRKNYVDYEDIEIDEDIGKIGDECLKKTLNMIRDILYEMIENPPYSDKSASIHQGNINIGWVKCANSLLCKLDKIEKHGPELIGYINQKK